MKTTRHPTYRETTSVCACGAVYPTRSTVSPLRVAVCAACHPWWTGRQRPVEPAGRVGNIPREVCAAPREHLSPTPSVSASRVPSGDMHRLGRLYTALAVVVGFQSHVKHHTLAESVPPVVMVDQPVKSWSSQC
jgi:large subunit ribosomal protein L31